MNRCFHAEGPDRLWVADMTYVPTWDGFVYLAIVLDAWSRRIVGWSLGERMMSDLVLAALNMALEQRRPPRAVIHHSDQGAQYTALEFGRRCKEMGVRPSMGSVGDAYDNAMAESFFATLECELIDRRIFRTKPEARLALFSYIEGWYNPRRRHSALGCRSPANFERSYPDEKHTFRQRIEHDCPPAAFAWHAPRRRWASRIRRVDDRCTAKTPVIRHIPRVANPACARTPEKRALSRTQFTARAGSAEIRHFAGLTT